MLAYAPMLPYYYYAQNYASIIRQGLILILLYSRLVHTSMSILDCPMLRDPSDQTVRPVSFPHEECFIKLTQIAESDKFVDFHIYSNKTDLNSACLY